MKRFSSHRLSQDRNAHRHFGDTVLFLVPGPRHALSVFLPPAVNSHSGLRCSRCFFVPTDERRVSVPSRRAPPASARVCELVRAPASNGIFCPWTPQGPFSLYVHLRAIHFSLIYFAFLTADYDTQCLNKHCCVFNAPDIQTRSLAPKCKRTQIVHLNNENEPFGAFFSQLRGRTAS